MLSRFHLSTIFLIGGAVWLLALWSSGVPVEVAWLRHLNIVVPSLLVILGVFDKWAWRLPVVNPLLARLPYLGGTWHVELQTNWRNPETGEVPGPITCYMAVRQTFSTLSMRLMTAESESWLIAHSVVKSNDGVFQVAGVYQNKPDLALRGNTEGKRSEMHFGALLLDVHGEPPVELKGHYWTDRKTSGTMRLTKRRNQTYPTFEAARRAFERRGREAA